MKSELSTPNPSQGGANTASCDRIARSFNRFELKYIVTLQQAEKIKSTLRDYLLLDDHSCDNGRYKLTSLYYDSPDLRCYWEKEYGLKFRRKLRIRHYDTGDFLSEETPVFVEIKQRVDRVTQKRRAVLSYADALRLCNDRQIPDCLPEDQQVVDEVFAFLWQYNLHPTSIIRYDRQAFVGTEYDMGLRVTFDTSLSFQMHQLRLHEENSGLPLLPQHMAVMEVKVNERIPFWLTNLIAAHNLQMVRVSKYCHSIETAQSMPSSLWRLHVPEDSQETLGSSVFTFENLKKKIGAERRES